MKKRMLALAVAALCCLIFMRGADSKTNWTLTKSKAGINNYIAPQPGSKYSMYMAVGRIKARAETLIELFRDVPAYTRWVYRCKENKLIKDKGNDNLIAYYVHDTPFPVKDRHSVVESHAKYDLQRGKVILRIDSINYSGYALPSGNVKMDFHAVFDFTHVDRETTKVVFTVKFNPGADLSPKLVDMTTKNLPLESLLKLRQVASEQKYINKGKTCDKLPLIKKFFAKKGM